MKIPLILQINNLNIKSIIRTQRITNSILLETNNKIQNQPKIANIFHNIYIIELMLLTQNIIQSIYITSLIGIVLFNINILILIENTLSIYFIFYFLILYIFN